MYFYLLLLIFFLLNVSIQSKNTDFLKFNAFIYPNKKYRVLIKHNNNCISKNKAIQNITQRNVFLKENIKNIARNKDIFKLKLFSSSSLSSIFKFFLTNKKSIKLAALHFIRIYKFIIYIRCLLEWLPQINPHLNPFVFIFTFTNNYVQFFHKIIPNVFGIDLSGIFSWIFLEMIENFLS
ncbi:apicoplast conserved ycf19 protein precursor, unknown function [Plasmodium relictum]|uniref:YGGT family protein n=1 Tax=Plasmodium relictum TaxID=85471 RepID=A0A1J1H4G5_PLARL|nr:apicoplast conserved ycf19 protein precursor, unknown function [Plasmodium relictum]CRG99798.1 apicoplast conserved ycf19 protein precursor, unknown function [Plasmodium relictum]